MKLSREKALKIAFLFDELIPPLIRDSKWFMYPPMKLLFGRMAGTFINFKEQAPFMTEKDYVRLYKKMDPYLIQRETCINKACIDKILKSVKGKRVLEAGCGNAYLAKQLSRTFKVTGVDILVNKELSANNPAIQFASANIEHLPFKNKSFDTVICTHTLEHVLNMQAAVSELRRVTKRRLIIVVPMQKPYKYTFDLHLHYFPYVHSLLAEIGCSVTSFKKPYCKNLGGDLYYQEDR